VLVQHLVQAAKEVGHFGLGGPAMLEVSQFANQRSGIFAEALMWMRAEHGEDAIDRMQY